ncbi:MAG: hypothetical protein GDA42_12870 [Ekhidna sp.]|nr:hypothetical protein [Ekhidna sp.]
MEDIQSTLESLVKLVEQLNKRMDNQEKQLNLLTQSFVRFVSEEEKNEKIIDNNFEILNQKIDRLQNRVNMLHSDTQQNFDEVKLELIKIQKTTGYQSIYENFLQVSKSK